MDSMSQDAVQASAAQVDALLAVAREALTGAATELEDGPLSTSATGLFGHAVAAQLRAFVGLVNVVGMTNDVDVLEAVGYGMHVAVEGVRKVLPSRVRALLFVREDVDFGEKVAQRSACEAACAARGWDAGPVVYQSGGGLRGWLTALRLVHAGCDVVVLDSLDRLGDTEEARMSVLGYLLRQGLRILSIGDDLDTGDPHGLALAKSLVA